MIKELNRTGTLKELGWVVGVSDSAVHQLEQAGHWQRGDLLIDQIHAYTHRLREMAAGRAAAGDLNLAAERARLAKEQADRVAMENEQSRRELAPVQIIELVIADAARQIVSVIEAIPNQLKNQSGNLNARDMEVIIAELNRARNVAATIEVDLDKLLGDGP